MQIKSRSEIKEKRRRLRKSMTESERMIWARLLNNQLGYRFLRQYSIGDYIVDFYCSKLLLAIEIDGKYHAKLEANLYDTERNNYLKDLGITTLRFKSEEVLQNIDKVMLEISAFPSIEGKVGKG